MVQARYAEYATLVKHLIDTINPFGVVDGKVAICVTSLLTMMKKVIIMTKSGLLVRRSVVS